MNILEKQYNSILNKASFKDSSLHQKVWWKCDKAEDHEWQATINDRKNGGGCPCCINQKVVKSNCLATVRPDIAKQWHPTENGSLSPNDVVAGSHKNVWWKCDKGKDHEWRCAVHYRLVGNSCPFCNGHKVSKTNCLAVVDPELAKQWHPIKNGTLTPSDVVSGSNKKVWWKCDKAKDHEWQAKPNDRKNQKGCPYCVGRLVCLSNSLATTHPEYVEQWHSKNGLRPTEVSYASGKKVWWKCKVCEDHEWDASVANRVVHGSECPYCKYSKGEKRIAEYLSANNIDYKKEFSFAGTEVARSKFDFKIKHDVFDGVIEYHGSQHYIPKSFGSDKTTKNKHKCFEENIQRDFAKEQWCLKNGVKMIVIPFWDYSHIDKVLNCVFNGDSPMFSEPPGEVKQYQEFSEAVKEKLK